MLQLQLALLGTTQQLGLSLQLTLLDEKIDEHRDLRSKHVRIERLEHVVNGAHRVALEYVRLLLVDGAQEDDRYRARSLTRLDDLGHLEAVHARHLYVEQNRGEVQNQYLLESFGSRVGANENLPQRLEDRFQREKILCTIVDEEDVRALIRLCAGPGGIARGYAHRPIDRHTLVLLPAFTLAPSLLSWISRRASFLSGTTSAVGTSSIAALGMIGISAVLGSCTSARPPRFTMCASPRAPSSFAPVKTTPIAADPYASPADANVTSIDGRLNLTGSSTLSDR